MEIVGDVPVQLKEGMRVCFDPLSIWWIKQGEVKPLPHRLSPWLKKKLQQGILIPVEGVVDIPRKGVKIGDLKAFVKVPEVKSPEVGQPVVSEKSKPKTRKKKEVMA